MPVVFAQPQPLAPSISADYGRTQEFNQTLPALASLYGQNQHAVAAAQEAGFRASQASADNRTRESIARDEMDLRDVGQMRQIQQERFLQSQQIQARERSQMFDWAVHQDTVSQQEVLRMQRQQAGLAQLSEDVDAGRLTKEEAADAAYQLRTGVDRVRQRLEAQQAQHQKAIGDMEVQAVERKQRAQLAGDALAAKTMGDRIIHQTMPDGTQVTFYQKGVDGDGNPTYDIVPNSKMETEAKRSEIVMKHYEAEHKAWLAEKEHYDSRLEKEVEQVRKVHDKRLKDGTEKAEPDMEQIHTEAENNMKRRGYEPPGQPPKMPGTSRTDTATEVKPPAAPTTPDQQMKVASNLIAQNPKLDGLGRSQALSTLAAATKLASKPNRTPDEQQQLKDMYEYLQSVTR